MYYPNKLKSNNKFHPIIPALMMVTLFAFAAIFIDISAGLFVMFICFALFAVFSFTLFLRTHNSSFLVGGLMQLLFAFYFATLPEGFIPFPEKKMAWFLYFCGIVIGIWMIILVVVRRKNKFKGRELFELVANATELASDGFTDRPRPAGKTTYTKDELLGFAEYIRRNLIALPYMEEDRVVLVPIRMGDEYHFNFSPESFRHGRTWIAFDFQGNITVSMSKRDYLAYKEELSFDQLCSNLGKLFIDFFELFKQGDGIRIIDRLNSLKQNPITE
ncbi:MAG: hypothetical protein ISR57_03230 [Bacteroidales bacterium]|nr:hypothetical protein [Bacteroidota bacterium]MBL6949636.1 hypothetical protein [Bacteroidales bacterium]